MTVSSMNEGGEPWGAERDSDATIAASTGFTGLLMDFYLKLYSGLQAWLHRLFEGADFAHDRGSTGTGLLPRPRLSVGAGAQCIGWAAVHIATLDRAASAQRWSRRQIVTTCIKSTGLP